MMNQTTCQQFNNKITRAGLDPIQALNSMETYILKQQTDAAIDLAYDLYRTGLYWNTLLWNRLMLIGVKYFCNKNPDTISQLYHLRASSEMSEPYTPESGGMMALCFIQAIRYLCSIASDDTLQQDFDLVQQNYNKGIYCVIPDFAYDHHTQKGREQGHNPLDFLNPEAGAKVVPEVPNMADEYKTKLGKLLTAQYQDGKTKFAGPKYNYWSNIFSIHGFQGDLLQSSFQKTIRRNMPKEALMVGYEMFISGKDFEDFMWDRLLIMSVEDIGMGDINSNRYMYGYNRVKEYFKDDTNTRLLLLFSAVRFMAQCQKERSTELIKGILVKEFEQGKVPKL